jgi:carboxylesterase type B
MYNDMFPFNADEKYLAQVMSFAWTKFAATGVSTGLDNWQQFDVANDSVYEFVTPAETSGPITGLRKSMCDFWDQIGYHY